jgi:hypothetical protein
MANESLSRAIDYLGAVEVAPGRYARQECASVPWEIIPEHVLIAVPAERIARFGTSKRAEYGIATMPAWWSPDSRFAWKLIYGAQCQDVDNRRFRFKHEAFDGMHNYTKSYASHIWPKRITADLETGQEVSA